MIPNIIHYIYGLEKDFGGKPFSFIHYLSILSAFVVNNPPKIYFHYQYEPNGYWWKKAKKLVHLNRIEAKNEIFGNKLIHYAHKADVARLEILMKYGGIYLDIDVICINPFTNLLNHECVLGREENVGLCNAVILCQATSTFISKWYDCYQNFDGNEWNYHSVKLPNLLAHEYPKDIYILNEYSFFYPMHDDIVAHYLWVSSAIGMKTKIMGLLQKIKTKIYIMDHHFSINIVIHSIYSREWHYQKLSKSYCIHLWETNWWNRYLSMVTPHYILNNDANFPKLLRTILRKTNNLDKVTL